MASINEHAVTYDVGERSDWESPTNLEVLRAFGRERCRYDPSVYKPIGVRVPGGEPELLSQLSLGSMGVVMSQSGK